MSKHRVLAITALFLFACSHNPQVDSAPTLPLARGADAVEIRDKKLMQRRPVDTSQCVPLGQRVIGPVAVENKEIAMKNDVYAAGGNLFFITSNDTSWNKWTITGLAYKCPPEAFTNTTTPK